ncbi:uncharacterized protein LOC114516621 [Dendronephthya gigantea]|uniref:uncharacterized protein LOC114516621 n=1 Tax=Dendronephthya gigantea TaxID=151771 RepID=UPI001069E4F7|nr:uncharacterized protein LOC114516621 [Dendronephthya gigantea]
MEGQTTLTSYFTAAKSRQNTNPAKRRKVVVDPEVIPAKARMLFAEKSVSSNEEKLRLTQSDSPATGRIKQANRCRSRNGKTTRKSARNKIVSEGIVSVTTSSKDDHIEKRLRKQNMVNNDPESSAKKVINGFVPHVGSQDALQAKQSEAKITPQIPPQDSPNRAKPEFTQNSENVSTDVSKTAPKLENITSQPRKGLKANPWIAEQAKLVLSSRGKQALEKSLGRKKEEGISGRMVKESAKTVEEDTKVKKSQNAGVKAIVPRLSQGVTSGGAPKSTSSTTESVSKMPAYKRFSHLLEAKKPKPATTRNLPLPYHFKVLEEMFRCVDVVLSLKQKRYETCTFEKLKDSVQEMCRKKFEKKHLAQMQTVFPTAFVFQQSNSCASKKSEYHLTIDFNFDGKQSNQKPKDLRFIESSILIARQKQFKSELLKVTMGHHRQYLTRNFPSLSVDDDAIMRWHPCFPLDEVSEIEQSPLPEPPQIKTYSTAQDVLDRARLNMTPRVEKALNLAVQKSKESNNIKANLKSNEIKKDLNQAKNCNPSLKGVSQSLIEKIRQKEEKKIQESLTVDSEVVQKRVMLQRLPELCRIMKTYFVSERKAAIPLEDVSIKLAESYTSTLSSVQIEKHVKLLSEVVPEWLTIMYVRKCPYVKLKKNVNINSLVEKLKSKEQLFANAATVNKVLVKGKGKLAPIPLKMAVSSGKIESGIGDAISRLYPKVDETETPLPRSWSPKDKCSSIGLSQTNLRVHYKGVGRTHKDAAAVRTSHPIPASCGLYYFEIKIISKGRDGYMGIGLSAFGVSLNRLPGWEKMSYGYHGDDGNSFSSSGTGKPYGPTFTTGDVIGCGVNMIDNTAFYTKNGIKLGTAFTDLPAKLYPSVGLQTPGEIVDANFGQSPFVYDIAEEFKELQAHIDNTIETFSVSDKHNCWQTSMQRLVSTYLVHHGYSATAEVFAQTTGQPISEDLASIKNRQRIQKLILAGRVGEAIEMTQKLYPGLLERNQNLLFSLKCRQFVEMVSGQDSEVRGPGAYSPSRSNKSSPCSSPTHPHSSSSSGNSLNSSPHSSNGFVSNGIQNGVAGGVETLMEIEEENEVDVSRNGVLNGSASQEEISCSPMRDVSQKRSSCTLGNNDLIEKILVYGRELKSLSVELKQEHGTNPANKRALEDAFSLLAYNDPHNSPVAYLLDPTQREPVCSALNSAILESQDLPRQPPLELCLGQTLECIKLMAKSGLGACAFTSLDGVLQG